MTQRVTKLYLLLILVLVFVGCKKTSNSSSAPNAPSSSAAPQTQPQQNHPGGGAATLAEVKYFKGSIGSSLDLQMKLLRAGEQLTGSYSYLKVGTKIDLRGSVDKNGNITLEEFDTTGKQTGLFKGIWKPDAEDGLVTIAGNWSKPPGTTKADDKKTAFSLHEEAISFTYGTDVVTKQIKENNKKLVYDISAQYPEITGPGNTNFDKFNQLVRGSVLKKVAGFKKDM